MTALLRNKVILLGFSLLFSAINVKAQSAKHWVETKTDRIVLHANDEYFELTFEVQEGLHIQADVVADESFISTKLVLDLPVGMETGAPDFPEPKLLRVPGTEEVWSVMDGTVRVRVPIKSLPTNSGSYNADGILEYQACTDVKCYFPRKLKFQFEIEFIN